MLRRDAGLGIMQRAFSTIAQPTMKYILSALNDENRACARARGEVGLVTVEKTEIL